MSVNDYSCLRVAVITGNDLMTSRQQITNATPFADVIELRLDYWENLNIAEISQLKRCIFQPIIFTLRNISQGGRCKIPESQRLSLIVELAALEPDYFDIEYDIDAFWVEQFRQRFPKIILIGSYHNFSETPHDLTSWWRSLPKKHFNIVKIATFANTICDTLRLLIFFKTVCETSQVCVIAMGGNGEISRILAPIIGSCFTYGYVAPYPTAAPGQLSLNALTDIYRFRALNKESAIYALLGDPVSQSPGHFVHNRAFDLLGKNAVYIKCRVPPEQLAEAMPLFSQLPFQGFSVTIPHKEKILNHIDELFADAEKMRIVNTIKREDNRYYGYNTDAAGCIDVLKKITSLENKNCLILGAGGSAKAIAYSLLTQSVNITLCNRTLSRAKEFTENFGGNAIDFEALFMIKEFPYDIIINTLPATTYAEQCAAWKIPPTQHGIAMDIILKPLETLFIQTARIALWRCITGDSLYTAQALRQLKIWFNQNIPANIVKISN
jgi:3-dehydroquinate dehydratase / shikimate dehydrogenase